MILTLIKCVAIIGETNAPKICPNEESHLLFRIDLLSSSLVQQSIAPSKSGNLELITKAPTEVFCRVYATSLWHISGSFSIKLITRNSKTSPFRNLPWVLCLRNTFSQNYLYSSLYSETDRAIFSFLESLKLIRRIELGRFPFDWNFR